MKHLENVLLYIIGLHHNKSDFETEVLIGLRQNMYSMATASVFGQKQGVCKTLEIAVVMELTMKVT